MFQPRQPPILSKRCPEFAQKDEWPKLCIVQPTGMSRLGAMPEKCHKLQLKPRRLMSQKSPYRVQTIWDEVPQEHITKAVANFIKRLTNQQ